MTPEQEKAITLRYVGSCGNNKYYEQISSCFIEDDNEDI